MYKACKITCRAIEYRDTKCSRFAVADWKSMVDKFRYRESGFIDDSDSAAKIRGILRKVL